MRAVVHAVVAAVLALALGAPGSSHAAQGDQVGPPPYGAPVSLSDADRALDAAVEEAQRNGWNVAVAVVDGGGHLVAFKRMNSVNTVIADIAIGKARTSAALRAPSSAGQGWLHSAPSSMQLAPFQGALPLVVGGRVVGAIGVSGLDPANDERVAAAGVAALPVSGH